MTRLSEREHFICDMDGVLYHGDELLPGAARFIRWLEEAGKNYLFLTNSSARSPLELERKMARLGAAVGRERFFTSALATAAFLAGQRPAGRAFVIGEAGLREALEEAGYTLADETVDYVVVGDNHSMDYAAMERAVSLIREGARLIATNPDPTYPTPNGPMPCTGALVRPIEMTTGVHAYAVGKPNPLMVRLGLDRLGCEATEAVVIGDRMDTDIVAGVEAGMTTVLALSGESDREALRRFAYRPDFVVEGVAEVIDL